MADASSNSTNSDNDLSWLTQEPSQKPKKIKIRNVSEIQHLSGDVKSNFEDFVFNIGLDMQASDSDSN